MFLTNIGTVDFPGQSNRGTLFAQKKNSADVWTQKSGPKKVSQILFLTGTLFGKHNFKNFRDFYFVSISCRNFFVSNFETICCHVQLVLDP